MSTNAITSSRTPEVILNEIKFESCNFKGVFFLVEGCDDMKFWKPHLDDDNTVIIKCEGKTKLLGAADKAHLSGLSTKITGVYDADLDHLLKTLHPASNVIPTDYNALEILLLRSQAFDKFLYEYGDSALINQFEKSQNLSVSKHIENISCRFGQLRLVNWIEKHGIDFKRLPPSTFVDRVTWNCDYTRLNASYADIAKISVQDLDILLSTHCQAPVGNWNYSQGHDALSTLAVGLHKVLGTRSMKAQDIAAALRMAYEKMMLQKTNMYQKLLNIEKNFNTTLFKS